MDQVEQVKEKIDLVTLINEFVPLKKMGRNFKANCPFHQEKSPSFVVSPERQIWHCFGCQKGGDCFTFLMEYEHIEFSEALRVLAQRVGIQLTSTAAAKEFSSQKELLYQMNSLAKEFYHYVLTQHKVGQDARAYLEKRGVSQKVIETFAIGFAPLNGRALVSYLMAKKHFSKEEVIKAGLAFPRGREVVDFFKGRLIFPLIDHRDNVVGFSGRLIDGIEVNGPKYINTRETLVYHKAEHCFGLPITKDAIRRANQVIVTEGEFDVLACFQHGVSNVVGVKGTALTEQHVQLLSRFAKTVTFCFDGDKAGQEAIKRSVPIVEKKGLLATVIEIPGSKDPDEALKNDPASFQKAVREDIGVYDYLLNKTTAGIDLDSAEGKKQVSEALLPFFAEITNEIVKEHYLRKIGALLHISYESVARETERFAKLGTRKPVVSLTVPKQKRPKDEVLEEYLLALIIQHALYQKLVPNVFLIFAGILPQERATQKLLYYFKDHPQLDSLDTESIAKQLPKELLACYDTCLLLPTPTFTDEMRLEEEVIKTTKKLLALLIQQRMRQLAVSISQYEEKGEDTSKLKMEFSELVLRLEAS